MALDPNGLTIKRLPELIEEREDAYREAFGDINTSPESVFGQIIGIDAEVRALLWALIEDVYQSQYPDTASGNSLDLAVALTGITRLPATATRAEVVVFGDEGTTLTSGRQAANPITGDLYTIEAPVTITQSSVAAFRVSVSDVQPSTAYTVTLGGINFTYNSGPGDDSDDILAGLSAILPGDNDIDDGEMLVRGFEPATLAVSANLAIEEFGSLAFFVANDPGATILPVGALIEIETPVSGWESIINYIPGATGRNRETDPELRIRRRESLRVGGAATVEAIRARLLQQVDGVTGVSVIENRLDVPDGDGRPPHSFEVVIEGGIDSAIAEKIWETKAAGIETTGNVEIIVTDSQGFEQPIRFTRPVPVYIWARMDVTPGTGFPSGGDAQIRDNLVAFGGSLGVGDDVLFQSLFCPIYNVPGIADVQLEIARTSDPLTAPAPGDWQAANIAISSTEISNWDAARVEVTLV